MAATVYRAERDLADLRVATSVAGMAEALSRNGWRVTAETGADAPLGGED